MSKSTHYRLRPSVPNPAGGEYPELSEALIEQNTDAAVAIVKAMMAKLVPLQLASARGNTKIAAEIIAALFVTGLTEFLSDNRAEDQNNSLDVYAASASLMVEHAKKLQEISLLRRILSRGREVEPEVQVFEVGPGKPLPPEIMDILRRTGN